MHEEDLVVPVRVLRGPNPSTIVFSFNKEIVAINFATTRPHQIEPVRFNGTEVVLVCYQVRRSGEHEHFYFACVGSRFEAPIGVQRCVSVSFHLISQRVYVDWIPVESPGRMK
jgi:hypothetical protein